MSYSKKIGRSALGIVACILALSGSAQFSGGFYIPSDTLHKGRLWGVGLTAGVGYTATMIGLNELWYSDYDRSDFHFFNDNDTKVVSVTYEKYSMTYWIIVSDERLDKYQKKLFVDWKIICHSCQDNLNSKTTYSPKNCNCLYTKTTLFKDFTKCTYLLSIVCMNYTPHFCLKLEFGDTSAHIWCHEY